MKLIVGLGNPGKQYERTRHNVGFFALDFLREKLGFPDFALQKKFGALISEGVSHGEKIILVKPQTYMNKSGEAVQKIFHFYRFHPEDLCLVYDDVDLPLGSFRIRQKGSAGTHNGMRSVISALGFQNFPRLRIGIESRGAHAPASQDVTSFVLQPFEKKEQLMMKKVLEEALGQLMEEM